MDDRVRAWLCIAPMPDVKDWLYSLFVDNIMKVSHGGENVPAAFAEYGKKLLADRIMEEFVEAKKEPRKGFSIQSGAELLTGEIVPVSTKKD